MGSKIVTGKKKSWKRLARGPMMDISNVDSEKLIKLGKRAISPTVGLLGSDSKKARDGTGQCLSTIGDVDVVPFSPLTLAATGSQPRHLP